MTNWLLMVSSKKFGTTSLPRTLAVCSMTQGFLVSQMKLQLVILMILMTLTPIIILVMDNVSQLICRYVCIDLWTYNNQKKKLVLFTSQTAEQLENWEEPLAHYSKISTKLPLASTLKSNFIYLSPCFVHLLLVGSHFWY